MNRVVYYTEFNLEIYGDTLVVPILMSLKNPRRAITLFAEFNLSFAKVYDEVSYKKPKEIKENEYRASNFLGRIKGRKTFVTVYSANDFTPESERDVNDKIHLNVVYEEELTFSDQNMAIQVGEAGVKKYSYLGYRKLLAYCTVSEFKMNQEIQQRIDDGYAAITIPNTI